MEQIVTCLGICVFLPIMIVWLSLRHKMKVSDNMKEIVLTALDKNPDMDLQELLKKISGPKKLLKEKLLRRQLWGTIFTIVGGGSLVGAAVLGFVNDQYEQSNDLPLLAAIWAFVFLSIGIAFLLNYRIGKKMLAKEIEAEERESTQR